MQYVDTVFLWVQAMVTEGKISLGKKLAKDTLADFLTKHVDAATMLNCVAGLGMRCQSGESKLTESIFDGSPAEVLFAPHVLMLVSPIRLEQHLLVDSCESFYGLSQARVCVLHVKSQNLRCHSGGMYRIHSF